jgi:hypothetical protein
MPRGKYERKKKKVSVSQKPKSVKEKRVVLTELQFHDVLAEARKDGAEAERMKQKWREDNKEIAEIWSPAKQASRPYEEAPYAGQGSSTNTADAINPAHYRHHPSGIECIVVTEHFNFNRGNAIKYIWRADEKGSPLENLRKAQWYLNREISRLEQEAIK